MRLALFRSTHFFLLSLAATTTFGAGGTQQEPLLQHSGFSGFSRFSRNVSVELFTELEELARIVDIAYCVGGSANGISKPFSCLSRCSDFPGFELVTTWSTGPLLSDSCGYIALDHGKRRIFVAFRGTYSIANTIVDLSTVPQEYVPYPGGGDNEDGVMHNEILQQAYDDTPLHNKSKCENCTVHMGFHTAWVHTRDRILPELQKQLLMYPNYQLDFVGHSLGGAVAAIGALDLKARGHDPIVTTFGEPRIGNSALVIYLNERFNLNASLADDTKMRYRRVTHVDDPVPLLPLSEWTFSMHAGEIFISKAALSPDIADLQHCEGSNDQKCIAGQDSTTSDQDQNIPLRKRDLLESVKDEIHDVVHEPYGIPSRYKLWQLFFAHRDYFWRLGLCMPSGSPLEQPET